METGETCASQGYRVTYLHKDIASKHQSKKRMMRFFAKANEQSELGNKCICGRKRVINMVPAVIFILFALEGALPGSSLGQNYWTQTNGPPSLVVFCIAVSPNGYIFVGTQQDGGVYRSTNLGNSWSKVFTNGADTGVYSLAVNSVGHIFAGTYDGKVYRSTDNGISWVRLFYTPSLYTITSILVNNNGYVFLTTVDSLYRSTNNGSTWQSAMTGLWGGYLFGLRKDSNGGIYVIDNYGVFRSVNNGSNWNEIWYAGAGEQPFAVGTSHFGRIIVGVADWWFHASYVYWSNDGGITWPGYYQLNAIPYSIREDPQYNLYAIGNGNGYGVNISTDGGLTWVQKNSGLFAYTGPMDVAFEQDGMALLSTINDAVFRSMSYPLPIQLASFTGRPSPNGRGVLLEWSTLSEINNYGFEIQRSSDSTGYQTIPNSLIPGHGTTNEPQYYTYTDSTVTSGIWYYRLKQIDLDGTIHYSDGIRLNVVTSVAEIGLPTVFSLSQNYPNPWNPTTTIRYGLPYSSFVTLTVYNTLGQEVVQLVNEQQQPGYYEAVLRGDKLASGVYFYRLNAGNFSSVKKLLLLK